MCSSFDNCRPSRDNASRAGSGRVVFASARLTFAGIRILGTLELCPYAVECLGAPEVLQSPVVASGARTCDETLTASGARWLWCCGARRDQRTGSGLSQEILFAGFERILNDVDSNRGCVLTTFQAITSENERSLRNRAHAISSIWFT